VFPPRQRTGGALAPSYNIPTVTLARPARRRLYAAASVTLTAAVMGRRLDLIWGYHAAQPVVIAWTFAFAFAAGQWLLSWFDRPRQVTPAEQARLDRMVVVVNIPIANECREIVDRAVWSVVCGQTRPPQRVDVIDDASSEVDYTDLAAWWEGDWPGGVHVRWIRRTPNMGKKHTQAITFTSAPDADIIVTVDSDTALERNAIAEGLKPFADRRVQSVAGIELAYNSRVNWLTRSVSARSMFFQLVACGAQSVFGDILVNRGAFALYRAPLIRRVVPAYTGETFWGWPVKLGDDAALTLFARGTGRAVQQPTAFALTMYPQTLSHHFRQWIRWMRGSTIRNCWRIRYLKPWSYSFWFTVIGYQTFLASTVLPVLVAATWPQSETFTLAGLSALLAWGYLAGLRITAIRRSDEGWWFRAGTVACYPLAMLWSAFILRPLRFYGIATFRRQGWTTRHDVELAIEPATTTAEPVRVKVPA
jgi:hyaluronan synthase